MIFAGSGRFSGYKFGLFPQSINEYYDLIKKSSQRKLKPRNHAIYAAIYLDILWNRMTYYEKFTKSKYVKGKFRKEIKSTDINFIDKKINSLSQWLLKPSSTFLNY